jgi:hypothetical protein
LFLAFLLERWETILFFRYRSFRVLWICICAE